MRNILSVNEENGTYVIENETFGILARITRADGGCWRIRIGGQATSIQGTFPEAYSYTMKRIQTTLTELLDAVNMDCQQLT